MNDHTLYWWLLQHLLLSTSLAVLVAAICVLLKPKPFVRHLMWLTVLCRLMIPPVATWPWALPLGTDSDALAVDVVDVTELPSAVTSPETFSESFDSNNDLV